MVYTPQRGFAQFQYFDQQATALAGMLANASDINLVDSAFVGPVDATVGLTAGIGVMVNPTVRSNRPGLNYDIVMPPDSAATDESFAGIATSSCAPTPMVKLATSLKTWRTTLVVTAPGLVFGFSLRRVPPCLVARYTGSFAIPKMLA